MRHGMNGGSGLFFISQDILDLKSRTRYINVISLQTIHEKKLFENFKSLKNWRWQEKDTLSFW